MPKDTDAPDMPQPGATEAALVDAHDVGADTVHARQPGLPRGVVLLLALAAGWIAIEAVKGLNEIIAPVFLALNLMIAAYPIKSALDRRRAPQWLGSLLTGVTVIVVLVALFWSLGWAVASLVERLPQYRGQFTGLYDQMINLLSTWGISRDQLEHGLQDLDPTQFFGVVQKAAASIGNVASLLAVVATVLIFMVMDAMGFGERLSIAREHNPNFVDALASFGHGVRKYWLVSTVFGLVVAVLDWGVLLVMGVPLAAVWAVLSFVTNYIPNIGFVIGLVPPALMALLEKGPGAALVVVVAYAVLNFVVQSVIQPKFAGDAVGVTPTVSFISLLFWAFVMGPLGAILALPATLFCKAIMIDADPENRWLNAFIAAKPKTAGRPPVRLSHQLSALAPRRPANRPSSNRRKRRK